MSFSCLRSKIVAFLQLLMLVAVAWCGSVHAQTDAYTIEVAVSERSESEKQDAYSAALRRVLLNNSGDKTLLNRDLIRQGLNQAENYVQAFSYRRPPPGTVISTDTPITRSVQQSGQATQLMRVSFDRELVNQLISDSAPGNADQETAPQPDQPPVVRYPTGDEEDRQLLSIEEIESQTFDPEKLAIAADRYAQDTLLIGYLTRNNARGWRGQWTRIAAGEQQQNEFETSSLDEGLKAGLAVLSSLAQIDETYRYGGTASSDTEGLVWVGSLSTTDDYARTMRFFEGVGAVGTVYPKEVGTSGMVFSVIPRSALVDIESALFDTNWLQRSTLPLSNDPGSLVRSADLAVEYRR